MDMYNFDNNKSVVYLFKHGHHKTKNKQEQNIRRVKTEEVKRSSEISNTWLLLKMIDGACRCRADRILTIGPRKSDGLFVVT